MAEFLSAFFISLDCADKWLSWECNVYKKSDQLCAAPRVIVHDFHCLAPHSVTYIVVHDAMHLSAPHVYNLSLFCIPFVLSCFFTVVCFELYSIFLEQRWSSLDWRSLRIVQTSLPIWRSQQPDFCLVWAILQPWEEYGPWWFNNFLFLEEKMLFKWECSKCFTLCSHRQLDKMFFQRNFSLRGISQILMISKRYVS